MTFSISHQTRASLEDTARHICESRGGKWSGTKGMACCPAHDDRTPSLGVRRQCGFSPQLMANSDLRKALKAPCRLML